MKKGTKVIELLDEEIEQHLESLINRAATESVRRKLRNLHEVCRHLIKRGKALTVPAVVNTYENLFDERIGDSTIRNRRNGDNLYQSLYRKWEQVAAAKLAAEVRSIIPLDATSLGEDQIRLINDPRLQHQVTLLVAKARSLEQQLNILKEERTDVPLPVQGLGSLAGGADMILSDGEIESLRDFVNPRSMTSKLLKSTKDGAVTLKDGRVIADPGFISALEKIVRSYERSGD